MQLPLSVALLNRSGNNQAEQTEEYVVTIHHLRRDYKYGSLKREDMPVNPMDLFSTWFTELRSMDLPEWFEVNAMSLSTHRLDGGTACRIVLLKEIQDASFLFFTNYRSDKGQEIAANPSVALGFYWPILDRQVRVEGVAEKTDEATSEKYFRSRPRSSQLSANASPQSEVVLHESQLAEMVESLDRSLQGAEVPRPAHWGGYRISAHTIEFWQGRPSRLHDRFRYTLEANSGWRLDRLGP